ncbi:hypothetical protein D9599_07720 [Roseomonas sp. KE2513]|nr:hypothetical protein [Roseomonas sp. KE2513]
MPPPRLRQACFDDHQQIRELESTFFPDSLPDDDRRNLFLNNPLWSRLGKHWPVGWVLEDRSGRIVGSLNNIPSLYRFRGEELVCANGHCWAVLPEYRGCAPMLMDEYFSQPRAQLFISSKVGADATPIWTSYATRVPTGDWETAACKVLQYRDVADKALASRGAPFPKLLALPLAAALRVKDACFSASLPPNPPSFCFEEAQDFDSRFDAFWEELLLQNPDKLLALRDRRALSWHFAIPKRANRIWIFTASRDRLLRAYCVLRQHTRPNGLRSVKLVDYQSIEFGQDLLPGLLRTALRRLNAGDNYLLEHHGCGLEKMQSFDRIAPYRVRKPAWSFYYHAADPALDTELRHPDRWDPSEYDGDASYK